MDRLIQVDRERLSSEMHQELEGMLAQVMDAVKSAGITNISIVTQPIQSARKR